MTVFAGYKKGLFSIQGSWEKESFWERERDLKGEMANFTTPYEIVAVLIQPHYAREGRHFTSSEELEKWTYFTSTLATAKQPLYSLLK